MKINFLIIRPGIDGGARIITQHAKFLQDAGHKVRIVSLGRNQLSLKDQVRSVLRGRYQRNTTIAPKLYHDADLDLTIHDFKEALTAPDIPDADISIATWWETAEWLAVLPPSKGAKVHFIQGHEATLPHGQPERAAAVHLLATQKITVSHWLSTVMKKEYGIDNSILVENGIDTNQFLVAARKKQSRPTVGFVFSVTNVKNSKLAIEACEKIRTQYPTLRVVTFGSEKPNEENPLPKWIEFQHTPSQQTIVDIYAQADAWLFTSREEGFGLPILEAMACGTPVVATRAGASPEILTQACGSLVESTIEAVTNAAVQYLDMAESTWQDTSTAARKRSLGYSLKASSEKFEQALQTLVDKNASRS